MVEGCRSYVLGGRGSLQADGVARAVSSPCDLHHLRALRHRVCDHTRDAVSRAKERFDFEAQVPFDRGIRRTVEWWEANR